MLFDDERTSRETAASTEEIGSFVQQMAREYFLDIPDRRSEPRYQVTVPVNVQRVDEDNNIGGETVRAVTRDLSVRGIGLICQDPLHGKLIVQVECPSGTKLRVLAQVLRCKANGYYFDVGCQFLRTA